MEAWFRSEFCHLSLISRGEENVFLCLLFTRNAMKIFFWILVSVAVLVGGYLAQQLLFSSERAEVSEESLEPNVTESEGRQYIEIRAKGGYTPRVSVAKADMPTTLRLRTESTFDCSSELRIPSLNVKETLSPFGVTEIDLGTLPVGVLQGSCGMGMYFFEIHAK
jgi:hypothetical protein